MYYVLLYGKKYGPFTINQIKELAKENKITKLTKIEDENGNIKYAKDIFDFRIFTSNENNNLTNTQTINNKNNQTLENSYSETQGNNLNNNPTNQNTENSNSFKGCIIIIGAFIFLSILVGSCLGSCSDTDTSSSSRNRSSYSNDYGHSSSTYREKSHTIYADNGEDVTYNDSKSKITATIWYHNETEELINELQAKGYRIIINESPFPPQYDSNYKYPYPLSLIIDNDAKTLTIE